MTLQANNPNTKLTWEQHGHMSHGEPSPGQRMSSPRRIRGTVLNILPNIWCACLDISFDQHFATSRDCVVVGAVQVVTCGELASLERTGLRLGDKGVRLVDMVYCLVDAVYRLTFVGMMALSDNFATCITSTSSSNLVFFGDVILL